MDSRNYHRFMMKRFLTLIIAAVCSFCSCEDPITQITGDSPKFSGQMTVVYEGEDFNQKEVKVQVGFNEDQTTIDIKLEKVKFVPAMPIRIDVTILGVPVTSQADGSWSFYANGFTPWAMGGPYDTYRVDELHGTLTDDTIDFSLDFFNTKKDTGYPTSYSGSLED